MHVISDRFNYVPVDGSDHTFEAVLVHGLLNGFGLNVKETPEFIQGKFV